MLPQCVHGPDEKVTSKNATSNEKSSEKNREWKSSPNIKYLGGIFLGPDVGYPGQKLYASGPFSVVSDREWPGCPGIWRKTSRIWRKFMQENFGLTFRSLKKPQFTKSSLLVRIQSQWIWTLLG